MKLWAGRFDKNTDKRVDDFNSSIHFDCRLYTQDIKGSVAHAKMLGKCNIISEKDALKIIAGLEEILKDIENNEVEFSVDAEDIHMNIEKLLIDKIGEAGKKLHTGRSRNDQVALDTRLYTIEEVNELLSILENLMTTIIDISKDNLETIMPGYTHLQRAQPITFAHHLMAYFEMFKRDYERLISSLERTNSMPLGAGALATTTYPIDREFVAKELGFDKICQNSMDAVSDRDFVIETIFCISMIMMHLSRFSEEIILWASSEFSFVVLDDAYSTGSSIMPQKKNPDVAELARGKTGRVYGDLMTLLSVMKSLPLAYNKDMQEDKEALFDAIDTAKMCIPVFTDMIKTMTINKENMLNAASVGFTNATDIADYLVKKGVPFRKSHEIIGNIVLYCTKQNIEIQNLSINRLKEFASIISDDVYEEISLQKCVDGRNVIGGPAKEAVEKHIKLAEKFIKKI